MARERGITEAEIIREAVEHFARWTPFRPDGEAWEQERAFIDRLVQQGPVAGKRTWRREDLYGQ